MKSLNLLILIFVFPLLALAESKEVGNGGVVIECQDLQTQKMTYEVFDLYESEILYGYKYDHANQKPAFDQAQDFVGQLEKLGNFTEYDVGPLSFYLEEIKNHIIFLPSGTGLKLIGDLDEFISPRNCNLIQTINYLNRERIYVDTDTWNKLTESQKAALLLHEAVYAFYRKGYDTVLKTEKNSVRTRRTIGYFLATNRKKELEARKSLPENYKAERWYKCSSDTESGDALETRFWYYFDKDEQPLVLFLSLVGRPIIFRTTPYAGTGGRLLSPIDEGINSSVEIDFNSPAQISPGHPPDFPAYYSYKGEVSLLLGDEWITLKAKCGGPFTEQHPGDSE